MRKICDKAEYCKNDFTDDKQHILKSTWFCLSATFSTVFNIVLLNKLNFGTNKKRLIVTLKVQFSTDTL